MSGVLFVIDPLAGLLADVDASVGLMDAGQTSAPTCGCASPRTCRSSAAGCARAGGSGWRRGTGRATTAGSSRPLVDTLEDGVLDVAADTDWCC